MNRQEFMNQLEMLLSDISQAERDEALQYYNDYLDDAGIENEESAIRALGSPIQVAANIKEGLKEGNEAGEFMENGFHMNNEEKDMMILPGEASSEDDKAAEETRFADGNTDGVFDAILSSGGANADIETVDAEIMKAEVVDAAVVNTDAMDLDVVTVDSDSADSNGAGSNGLVSNSANTDITKKENTAPANSSEPEKAQEGFVDINPDPFRGLYKDIDSCQIHGKEQNMDSAQAGQGYQGSGQGQGGQAGSVVWFQGLIPPPRR